MSAEPDWRLSKYFQYLTFSPPVPEHAICGTNITLGPGQIIPAADIPCHQIESFYTWHPLKGINLDILMLFIDGLLYFLFIGNQSTNQSLNTKVMITSNLLQSSSRPESSSPS